MTTPQTSSHLSEDLAVRAYAAMMNTGSAAHIEPLLADDFRYAFQWVFKEMVGKQAYLDYITAKLETVTKVRRSHLGGGRLSGRLAPATLRGACCW